MLPTTHSFCTMMYGPEPIAVVIAVLGSSIASCSRKTKSGFSGEPIASSTSPKGWLSRISNVSAPVVTISLVNAIIVTPVGMRLAQRWIESTASFDVTGVPSWNLSPGRSLNFQVSPSALFSQPSSICGFGCSFSSNATSTSKTM